MKHFLVHLLQDSRASYVNPIGWMVMRLSGCGNWWINSHSYFVLGEECCKLHVELTWLASIWFNLFSNCVCFWCSCFPSLICRLIVGEGKCAIPCQAKKCYSGKVVQNVQKSYQYNVCASTTLTALWFQHSQMKPRFLHPLLIQCDWGIHSHLCGITPKLKTFSAFCAHQ
jgi:hypothetical protein